MYPCFSMCVEFSRSPRKRIDTSQVIMLSSTPKLVSVVVAFELDSFVAVEAAADSDRSRSNGWPMSLNWL